MSQEVRVLKLKDLVLWTENPRDPIDETATDQDIANLATEDRQAKWNLSKLARDMGDHYDFSELPTVVFHGKKPVVYDGNRRIILGKIKHGFVHADDYFIETIPEFPVEIPCNVCSKAVGLKNVLRKHAETGSWLPLERDIFLHKHMKEKKSTFLALEDNTGIISSNPHLNQRFVKEEIFKEDILEKLGITFVDDKLHSKHSNGKTIAILMDIAKKVSDKTISTRNNRGKVLEILDPENQETVANDEANKPREVKARPSSSSGKEKAAEKQVQSRRVRSKAIEIFGGPLYLKIGGVSNLYRDIVDLHKFFEAEKSSLSDVFPCLIRMSLRLLCESAAKELSQDIDRYVELRFSRAKSTLDKDLKTALSNNNVNEKNFPQLLHTGAHNYVAAANMDQTMAMSIILGAMLTDSHGKGSGK